MTDRAAGGVPRRRAARDAAAAGLILAGLAGLAAAAFAADVLAGAAVLCALAVAAGVLLGLER